jgi:hypothetical protein
MAYGTQYVRFLVPFVDTPARPGAYGSQWEAQTWIHNRNPTHGVGLVPTAACLSLCTVFGGLDPSQTSPTPLWTQYANGWPALLVQVDAQYADDLTVSSRIRDRSRDDQSAGVRIPVVREEEMFAGLLELVNVPLDSRFRVRLRIYALPETSTPMVTVRYFDLTDHLLFTEDLLLEAHANGIPDFGGENFSPSKAERGGIEMIPALAGKSAMRIEIAPRSDGLRFWAFASVTNNVTQEVTVVAP